MGVIAVVSSKPLSNFLQLRLDIFDVEEAKLGQDGAVQEEVGLVPSPGNGGNRGLSSEGRRSLVSLVDIRLHKDVAWQNQVVVCLDGVGLGDVIIRREGSRNAVDMRSKGLVVFVLDKSLIPAQPGLDGLCPLFLAKSLSLCNTRSAVFGCIGPSGCDDFLIDLLIVGPCQLYIRSSMGVIVWLKV